MSIIIASIIYNTRMFWNKCEAVGEVRGISPRREFGMIIMFLEPEL